MNDKTTSKKCYIPMGIIKWSSVIVEWPAGIARLEQDLRRNGSVGFLPVYESVGELTKHWGGDAPYITVEAIDPERNAI
jgi:hypothetical protein